MPFGGDEPELIAPVDAGFASNLAASICSSAAAVSR